MYKKKKERLPKQGRIKQFLVCSFVTEAVWRWSRGEQLTIAKCRERPHTKLIKVKVDCSLFFTLQTPSFSCFVFFVSSSKTATFSTTSVFFFFSLTQQPGGEFSFLFTVFNRLARVFRANRTRLCLTSGPGKLTRAGYPVNPPCLTGLVNLPCYRSIFYKH